MCYVIGCAFLALCMTTDQCRTKHVFTTSASVNMLTALARCESAEPRAFKLPIDVFWLVIALFASSTRSGSLRFAYFLPGLIIFQQPPFTVPTVSGLTTLNRALFSNTEPRPSEALDFRPMNQSVLPPVPVQTTQKDTYFWNRPTAQELLLSYHRAKEFNRSHKGFGQTQKPVGPNTQHQTNNIQRKKKQRKKYNYRPHLWTPLLIENCYNSLPPDVLTSDELAQYEDSLYTSMNPYSHPSRIVQRNNLNQTPIDQKSKYPAFAWFHDIQRNVRLRHGQTSWITPRSESALPTQRTHQGQSEDVRNPLSQGNRNRRRRGSKARSRRTRSYASQLQGQSVKNSRHSALGAQAQTVITVHRVLIRPSVVELENGSLHARLRYIIQLHRKLTGYYRLIIEARIDPDYPPIYVGNVQNVCAHWPANLPHSNCSTDKSRFYQKGQICFCHMPAGIYRQRLRLNLSNILDGLEVPRFLVNFLFNGKKMNIYLSLKLENENDEVAGCLNLTLPLLLKSA